MKRTSIEARRWLFPGALSAILAGSGLWYGLTDNASSQASSAVSKPTQSAILADSIRPSQETGEQGRLENLAQESGPATTPDSLGPQPFAASLSGTDLSEQGKQALVQWHRNQLPEQLRTTEQHLHASSRQQQARTAVIESASSPEEAGRQLAELGVNQQGVESVVNYLKQREHFDQRFEDFREAVDREASSGLADADLEKQREALLERHFPQQQDRTWARLKMLGNG